MYVSPPYEYGTLYLVNMIERYIHIYRVYVHVVHIQKICISTISYKYRVCIVCNTYRIYMCLHRVNMVQGGENS